MKSASIGVVGNVMKSWLFGAAFMLGLLLVSDARADIPATMTYGSKTATYTIGQMPCAGIDYGTNPYMSDSRIIQTKYCLPRSEGSTSFAYGWSLASTALQWPGRTWPCGYYVSCPTGV